MSESGISREARVHIGGGQYEGPTDSGGFVGIRLSVAGQEAIDRAIRLLAGVEGGLEKALRSATSRAAARLRSANVQAVRERYAISASNIRENENVQVTYSYNSGVQAFVRFGGERIPLYRFDGASPSQPTRDTGARLPVMSGEDHWRMMYPSVPAAGHVLKSTSPRSFSHAFVARMKSGHVGIFERTAGGVVRSLRPPDAGERGGRGKAGGRGHGDLREGAGPQRNGHPERLHEVTP